MTSYFFEEKKLKINLVEHIYDFLHSTLRVIMKTNNTFEYKMNGHN